METRITKLLGIKYPVIQGGMAWVATHELASAVSNAGGLGIIGAGGAPASWVKEQIVAAKKETDKPFGVNLMLMNPEADEIAKIIAEEKVKVVTTGAGNPAKYMDMWKEAGVIVNPCSCKRSTRKAHGERRGKCSNRRGNGVRRTYRSTDYHDTCATGC